MQKRKFVIVGIGIFMLISIISVIKGYMSLKTYRNALNLNVCNTMFQIVEHSEAITYSSRKLIDGEYNQYNISKFRSNYDEVLQDIQQLNTIVFRFDKYNGIDIKNFTNIYDTIDINELEQMKNNHLSEEEIEVLIKINRIFNEISNIIDEDIKNLDRDTWNNPNILKDSNWIKIMKEINNYLGNDIK